MPQGLEISVIGKVQGVWFRGSTREKALSLDLTGWVKNKSDGSVLIHAFGEPEKLQQLTEWCKHGPPHAIVEEVIAHEIEWEICFSFEVRR